MFFCDTYSHQLLNCFTSVLGLTWVGLSGIGNRSSDRVVGNSLVGLTFSIIFNVGLFSDANGQKENIYLISMGSISGIIVVICHLNQIIGWTLKRIPILKRNAFLNYLLTPGGDIAEARLKVSASHKVHRMLENALDIVKNCKRKDSVMDSYFGQALLEFSKQGKRFEPTGGIIWTWRRCLNCEIFEKEGIWFTTRLLANNFTQLVISGFFIFLGMKLIREAEQNWSKEDFQSNAILGVNVFVNNFTDQLINGAQSSETFVNEGAANFSSVVSDILVQQYLGTDYNCSLVPSAIMTATDNGTLSCNEHGGVACISNLFENYCGDFNTSMISEKEMAQYKMAALNDYGHSTDIFKNITKQLLLKGTETSIQSFYPNELRM